LYNSSQPMAIYSFRQANPSGMDPRDNAHATSRALPWPPPYPSWGRRRGGGGDILVYDLDVTLVFLFFFAVCKVLKERRWLS
jgi:hypothetical protein